MFLVRSLKKKVVFKKKHYTMKANAEEILLIPAERRGNGGLHRSCISPPAIFINTYDCYGVKIPDNDPLQLEVYALVEEKKFKRTPVVYHFKTASTEEAHTWLDVLQHVLTGTKLGGALDPCPVLIAQSLCGAVA